MRRGVRLPLHLFSIACLVSALGHLKYSATSQGTSAAVVIFPYCDHDGEECGFFVVDRGQCCSRLSWRWRPYGRSRMPRAAVFRRWHIVESAKSNASERI